MTHTAGKKRFLLISYSLRTAIPPNLQAAVHSFLCVDNYRDGESMLA